jgi:hypothetical protein
MAPTHGNRYARVYASGSVAADTYRHNGERLRYAGGKGTKAYPVGTVLVMETFEMLSTGEMGETGPLFFMRKEAPGYDPSGGDWRYAMTTDKLMLFGEGIDGPVTECRACHAKAKARDYVFTKDR